MNNTEDNINEVHRVSSFVKIKLHSDAIIPQYQSEEASGADLLACLSGIETPRPIIIPNGETRKIPTGISIEMPRWMEAQIRGRSGLASQGIMLINSPGTIDSDYRGEIGVLLHNSSGQDFIVWDGDRIAQIVFCPVIRAEFIQTETLSGTPRGENGFGSTGK